MRNTRLWLRLRLALPAAVLITLALSLAPASAAPAAPEPKTKRMIVLFDDESAVANAARFAKILHRFKVIKGFVCEVPESQVTSLRTLKGVKSLGEDRLIHALPADLGNEYGFASVPDPLYLRWTHKEEGINAENSWNTCGVDGSGVRIAVLDSGVNYDLPDLSAYLGGKSFVDPDMDPIDNGVLNYPEAEGDHSYSSWSNGSGHGTLVTSLACSRGQVLDATIYPNRKATGIGPEASYYALKVLRSGRPGEYSPSPLYPGPGQGLTSWVCDAIDWSLSLPQSQRPHVINMSLCGYEYDGAFEDVCNDAYNTGVLLVAGSGNANYGYSGYPAAFENVISVGAHTVGQTKSSYSNGGVNLVAPGGTTLASPDDWVMGWAVMGEVYRGTGTSFAAPHISGMFALMIQYARNIYSGRQNQMQLNNGYYWEAATHSCHDLGLDPVWQGKGKADAKLAIDLIANRWPINRSLAYSPITGSTLNCSTTITNILSNSVPTPIGEQIANLSITATQAYYGENNEAALPGTTPDKPVLTGGSLDLPGSPGATQVIDCSDPIDTANLPNIARTELKFSFNFVNSPTRTMTITDPYAALWDPHFISPTISSVVVSPARVAAGDSVHVTVNVSDNGNVASVTANSTALSHTGGNVWEGDITAESGLGSHTVTVVAKDEANLDSTDTSASYRTDRVMCAGNLSVHNACIHPASGVYLFKMLGRVKSVDGDSFTLDDGSGQTVSVTAPGHSLLLGDYAVARGVLNAGVSPPTLTGSSAHAVKLD